MTLSLSDQCVLITGASSGIGKSCAQFFAQAGARLILAARRKEKLQTLSDDLQKQYQTQTLLLCVDVQDFQTVTTAIEGLPTEWKAIDVLINNAGLSRGLDKQYDSPIQDWDEMIDTNIKGL
ncbi:MAG: SDR family NAD(P)-dependent oxidoreductase, partial [Leptolyngbyaceae cyanobacterium MAG.088]|nr:SDR family NAD(P)-dependent oxidoreductase [Leptolyngbyaceae cyanobacterium MAG.088]